MLPVEIWIYHHRLRHARGAVAAINVQIRVVSPHAIGENRFIPINLPIDCARIGIDQQLCRVKPEAGGRVPRAMHPVSVELARLHTGNVAVPDKRRLLRNGYAVDLASRSIIVETKLDPCRVL